MVFFIIHDAAGQTSPVGRPSSGDRKAACDLIEATLQKPNDEKHAAGQLNQYQKTSEHVLKLCPNNIVVTQVLKEAMAKATKAKSDRQAAKVLALALRDAQETLAFKPFIEAALPEGFPEPTPVGEIQLKHYPTYRMARTQMAGAETGAFWILFTHIKKKDISMTAPVEMTYSATGKDELQGQSMGFLYSSTKQGEAGKDEQVEVVDIPAMMAASFGIRGDVTKARLAEAKAHLDVWLKQHADEFEASGPLRVMGYNSPFVAASRRYAEVQIPVGRITKPR
ncbi:MAG TPA: heme-binding protein [Gemmataceae bacterium]|nr:heme-binding protein [Gemmataceae bacterium]